MFEKSSSKTVIKTFLNCFNNSLKKCLQVSKISNVLYKKLFNIFQCSFNFLNLPFTLFITYFSIDKLKFKILS